MLSPSLARTPKSQLAAGQSSTGRHWNSPEKRMKRNEDNLRDLWNNIKCNNILIIGVPEGEERQKGQEKIFEEIIVENI